MGSWPWKEIAIFAAIFAGSTLVTLALTSILLIKLPADYFVKPDRPVLPHANRVLRILVIVGKNVLGYILIVAGILLSIPGVPGQGFLTILIGLMLVDFPGKYRVERWMIRRRSLSRAANWVRRKAHKPAFERP